MADTTESGTPSIAAPVLLSRSEPHSEQSPPFSSADSSGSDSDRELRPRLSRLDRPKLSSRKASGPIIVHKTHPEIELKEETYPPDDARAMSPRRNSEDVEKLGQEARQAIKEQALTIQSSLAALAERIDEVKSDHDKLETENRFLQDYIGGLTRTMSKSDLGSGGKSKK